MNHVCRECGASFSSFEHLQHHKKQHEKADKIPKKFIWIAIVAVIVIIALIVVFSRSGDGQYDSFAQCISDSGAKFYGAWWCPHCNSQKKEFGSSAKYLPYIECSTKDGKSQLQVCTDAGIDGYPTWEFADGTRLSGEVSMQVLASKTGCELP